MAGILIVAFGIIWTAFGVWLVGSIESAGHRWTWRLGGWVIFAAGSLVLMSLMV